MSSKDNERARALRKLKEYARAARKALEGKTHVEFVCPNCGGTAWAYKDFRDRIRSVCDNCNMSLTE